MDIHVQGSGPAAPFLAASDRFETTQALSLPVEVTIYDDPDRRTRASHYDDYHTLEIARATATSAMATELAVHEYAHMRRHEEDHPSHTLSTRRLLYDILAGRQVEQDTLAHCYQIANHLKDIYADDLTLQATQPDKLIRFLEAGLARSLSDRPTTPVDSHRLSHRGAPRITAVNAAFAVGLLERHDLLPADHRIYDLTTAASVDAPAVPVDRFRQLFSHLPDDPTPAQFRDRLREAVHLYVDLPRPGDTVAAD